MPIEVFSVIATLLSSLLSTLLGSCAKSRMTKGVIVILYFLRLYIIVKKQMPLIHSLSSI